MRAEQRRGGGRGDDAVGWARLWVCGCCVCELVVAVVVVEEVEIMLSGGWAVVDVAVNTGCVWVRVRVWVWVLSCYVVAVCRDWCGQGAGCVCDAVMWVCTL